MLLLFVQKKTAGQCVSHTVFAVFLDKIFFSCQAHCLMILYQAASKKLASFITAVDKARRIYSDLKYAYLSYAFIIPV